MKTYTLAIGSLVRELPVVRVSDKLSIASFVMLGDTALVEAAADALVAHPHFPRSGKKVCIIDDVVSTGGSLDSLGRLLARTGCTVMAKAAVLLEEGGYTGEDLIYLARLPVIADS